MGNRVIFRLLAQIDNGSNLDTCIQQIQCSAITFVIAGDHNCSFAGTHSIEVHQSLGGTAHDHAGQIVVVEHSLLFHGANTEDGLFSAHFVESLATDNRQPVIGEPTIAGSAGHGGNISAGFNFGHQALAQFTGSCALGIQSTVIERATEAGVLIHQQYFATAFCRFQRSG